MINKYLGIGINGYPGALLRGCIPDIRCSSEWLIDQGWYHKELRPCTDDHRPTAPTRLGIWRRLCWLVEDAKPGDKLILHYSGHGAQIPTRDSDREVDGLLEVLCPIDFDRDTRETWLRDVDFMRQLKRIPVGVDCTVVLDSCYSGGMDRGLTLDADRCFNPRGERISRAYPVTSSWDYEVRYKSAKEFGIKPTPFIRTEEVPHICFMMGCREDQTCAEKYFNGEGYRGAWSKYLFDELAKNPSYPRVEVAHLASERLEANGFVQKPIVVGPDELLSKRLG